MFNSNLYKLLLLLQLFCFALNAKAEEKITSYHVYIKVLEDSTLQIREQIDVIAEGNKIKRGIYRDFPTTYVDSKGLKHVVGFDVSSVHRDGQKENYKTERISNGTRVRIGNADKYLEQGAHSYNLSFTTNRQLGFFNDHDELYFNAIPHGWDFKIDKVLVTVELPKVVSKEDIKVDGFTGPQGSTDKNFKVLGYTENGVSFATTSILNSHEGFTIVVGWPKGIVKQPTATENLKHTIKSSFEGIIALLLAVVSLFINLFFWLTHGVDPKKGTVYPRFAPPKDFAPYEIPFIIKMGYTPKCLSSAIVSSSVKGHAIIREESGILGFGATFHIDKAANQKQELDPAEQTVLDTLLRGTNSIECSSSNHSEFEAAKRALTAFCEAKLGKYYRRNIGWTLPGIGLNAGAVLAAFSYQYPPLIVLICGLAASSTIVFFNIIKRYSTEGRAILDEIEGYKMYLDTAEKGHYDNIQFPQLNQERFESHLPYAVALGVEAHWMGAFRKAMTISGHDANNYRPYYYMGDRSFTSSKFMNDGNSAFSSKIASSSTPPGSSSGFSGGGSSGGGGGGGGGGGW